MSLTNDDLLKKLKATKAFVVSEQEIRRFAEFAAAIGPDEFVKRWTELTKPTGRLHSSSRSQRPTALAELKERAAKFGGKRKLSSGQTALAIYSYFKAQKKITARPPKAAEKGVSSTLDWLAKQLGNEAVREGLEAFFSKYESDTDLTHRLSKPAN
jgi:hypothetical protein